MAEDPQPLDPPEEPEVQPDEAEPRRRRRRRRIGLFGLRLLAVFTAVLAGLIVTFFSIDLGPHLIRYAEKGGSAYLKRPMHIGKLRAFPLVGDFVVEDLVIEGLKPTDRPFLRAKKITVDLPWWSIATRLLVIENVTMTDWEMVIEQFPPSAEYPTGTHNLPRFKPE